jgi:glycosyltransferase involved in cell wall biosynthesis
MPVIGGVRRKGKVRQSSPGQPLVSVIIAVLNAERCLETAIRSVIGQTYPNVELIVLDGGSTDGGVNILRRYDESIDLWLSERDQGLYYAWNKGVQLAHGDWIAFLGSDDYYHPDAIRQYVEYIQQTGSDFEYVSSRIELLCPNGVTRLRGSAWNWKTFRVHMNVAHVGSLHRRTLFERLGPFNTEYRVVADYEFLLRARESLRAGFLDRRTAVMRGGGVSDSTRALEEALKAKILSGGRPQGTAKLEDYWARAKFLLRKLVHNRLLPYRHSI